MRVAFLAAMLLLSLVPAAPAQSAGHFLEDPEGDPELVVFLPVSGAPVGGARFAPADLRAMDLAESDEAFDFTITVGAFEETLQHRIQYNVQWTWGDMSYVVYCVRDVIPSVRTAGICGVNSRHEEEGRIDEARLPATFDAATATIKTTVPKVYLRDLDDKVPTKNDVFADINVRSYYFVTSFGFFTQVTDRMPDSDGEPYTLLLGDEQAGHVFLSTENRVRVSNGGATTFVYQLNVTNAAEIEDTIRLAVADIPEGWNVTVQSPIRVPGKGSVNLAVLASVPFEHDHGGFSSFNVTATSDRDRASFASMRFGVLHTPIPQPAGHHSQLYLHAPLEGDATVDLNGDGARRGVLNTDSARDGEAGEVFYTDTDGNEYVWVMPLDPGLAMGMDWDTNATGTVAGSLLARFDGMATVRAEVLLVPMEEAEEDGPGSGPMGGGVVYAFDDAVLLAESDASEVSTSMSGASPFSLTLTPTAESDYVPFAPRQNLVLLLRVATDNFMGGMCCFAQTTPAVESETFLLELPLEEYHDRLTGVNEVAGALALEAEGLVEKVGRPGSVMTYTFSLVNPTAEDLAMEIDVAGNHADLGTVVPSGVVGVPARGSIRVTLAVAIPDKAEDGQELEVLVFAHARDDPSKMAIARTKTLVARGSEAQPDETAILQQAQADAEQDDTPGAGAAFVVLAGLAAVALSRRKK